MGSPVAAVAFSGNWIFGFALVPVTGDSEIQPGYLSVYAGCGAACIELCAVDYWNLCIGIWTVQGTQKIP